MYTKMTKGEDRTCIYIHIKMTKAAKCEDIYI